MDETKTQNPGEVCHRCLQPVPPAASRCPHCGDPVHKSSHIRTILGVLGLLMFLAAVVVAVRLMQTSGPRPATDDDQHVAGQPDTPPPPEKKPALGQ